MPSRWVICPVIFNGGVRKPKVSIIVDAGREPVFDPDTRTLVRKTLRYSSAVSFRDWALCFVTGEDLSNATNDPEIVDIFETDFEFGSRIDLLTQTPKVKGWTRSRIDKLIELLGGKGVTSVDITPDTTFEEILFRLGDAHADVQKRGRFNPRTTYAK